MLYIKRTHIPQCNIWGLVHADCSVMHVVLTQDNDKETYYNAETLQLQRYHQYGNVQG